MLDIEDVKPGQIYKFTLGEISYNFIILKTWPERSIYVKIFVLEDNVKLNYVHNFNLPNRKIGTIWKDTIIQYCKLIAP